EMKRMVESDDPVGAINHIFEHVINECGDTSDAPGCFLINSLLDINGINERITDTLREYMAKLEQSYMLCIEKAQAKGQVPLQHNASAYAHFILSTIFSLRTMAKLNMPQEHLRDVHACAMKALTTAG